MNAQQLPLPRQFDIPRDFHINLRRKFLHLFRTSLPDSQGALILLRGADTIHKHDDDQDYRVEQESNFFYLFGVQELDCYGLLDVTSGQATLFTPKYPESNKMWTVVKSKEDLKAEYPIDSVLYVDELDAHLKKLNPPKIYYYQGEDSDSKRSLKVPDFPFLQQYPSDYTELFYILNESRVTKTSQEIDVIRYIARLSSEAHEDCLRKIRDGNKEFQIEALFKYHTLVNSGCRFTPYECICAGGVGAATLHYIENDKTIGKDKLILADMGGKYHGYCSDITVTFPSSGRFTEKQKVIYNAVLDAQKQVFQNLKVGVNWGDMHMLAEKVIVQNLLNAGLVRGSMNDLMANRIGKLFFPHGLGHLLGLRTHDVGGYNRGCPERLPELSSLRFRRNIEKGMVFTNEPGCYFIEFILNKAYEDPVQSQFLVKDKIQEYMEVGGVRLEDDLAIKEDGTAEILNKVPRSVEQVEACMRGEDWTTLQ